MKDIILVCAQGMSTSLVVNRMIEEAKNSGARIYENTSAESIVPYANGMSIETNTKKKKMSCRTLELAKSEISRFWQQIEKFGRTFGERQRTIIDCRQLL